MNMGGSVQQIQFITLKISRIQLVWAIVFFTILGLTSGVVFAAAESKSAESGQQTEETPIQITAEQLEADNEEKYAEFIGNVKAIQADFVITSDKLRIYYRGELLNTGEKGSGDDMLKKIIATGNVKITTDQYYAETEKLEYDTASMTIVLIGENSKVINGKNSITGSKIILYQKDGRVKVLGSKNKRIKAEFFSQGKTSDNFKIGTPKE